MRERERAGSACVRACVRPARGTRALIGVLRTTARLPVTPLPRSRLDARVRWKCGCAASVLPVTSPPPVRASESAAAHAELTHELTQSSRTSSRRAHAELTQSSRRAHAELTQSSRRAHGGETEFRAYVGGASDGRCRVVVLCTLLPAPPFSRRSEGRPAKERKRVSRHGTCDERCQR